MNRLMFVLALFGIFASASITFAQFQQPPQGGGQQGQYGGGQGMMGAQQGQYQGQMPQQGMMGGQGQGSQYQGQQDIMRQYQGQMPPGGQMPGGFDPSMDPSKMGQYQGQMPPNGKMPQQGMQQGAMGGQGQGGQYQGQQGGMPQGGQQGMMQGPGKEFFSRMIQQMKSNMKPFESMVKNVDKQIVKVQTLVQKCGISPNFDEIKKAVSDAQGTISKVKTLDPNAEDMDFSPEDIGDIAQTVSEGQRHLMQYDQFCRNISAMEKDIKGIVSRFTKIEKNLTKSKLDLSDSLADQRADIAELQGYIKQAKDQASKDIEDAAESMQEFQDKRNDISDRERALQMASNFSRELKNIDRDVKLLTKSITSETSRAAKKKVSTEALTEAHTAFKDAYTALQNLSKKKGVDPDDLVDAMQDVFDVRRDVDDALNQLRQGSPKAQQDMSILPGGWNDIAKYSQQRDQQNNSQEQQDQSENQDR